MESVIQREFERNDKRWESQVATNQALAETDDAQQRQINAVEITMARIEERLTGTNRILGVIAVAAVSALVTYVFECLKGR